MQDFEKVRFAAALKGFQEAFDKGFERGLTQLKEGVAQVDKDSVFYVDIPQDPIHDNEWQPYALAFEEAGREAALAKRRPEGNKAKLLAPDPESQESRFERTYRWAVNLSI